MTTPTETPSSGWRNEWVNWMTDWGRPVVATVVLTMCAPGEHFLALLAGWNEWLAWGMPAVLTAYAGISAVVAAKRPKGEGKKTAVAGAVISILAAMAAQPVAHLLALHGPWDARHTVTLVVSCIPPLVLGHLLHLAADQKRRNDTATVETRKPSRHAKRPATRDAQSWEIVPAQTRNTPAAETPRVAAAETAETRAEAKTAVLTVPETQELLTAAEAAQVASQVRGATVTASTIRTWKHRGRLAAALEDDMTLYRRDDVVAAATQ